MTRTVFGKEGRSKIDKVVGAQAWSVDEDYINTLGIKLIEGRNFMPLMASDSQAVIINQAMAKALELKDPVGKNIMNWRTYTVIGVVENFHYESMKGEIRPLCMMLGKGGDITIL